MSELPALDDLEVITDPHIVASVITETAARQRELAIQIAQADKGQYEHIPLLKRFREDVAQVLIPVVLTAESRAAAEAWRLLEAIEYPGVIEMLTDLLTRLSEADLTALLHLLAIGRRNRISPSEIVSKCVASFLDSQNPRIRLYAAGICANWQIPDTLDRVFALLDSLDIESAAFLGRSLVRSHQTVRLIEAMATRVNGISLTKPPSDLYLLLINFIRGDDPVLVTRAVQLAATLVTQDENQRLWDALVRALLRYGGPDAVPILKMIAERSMRKWLCGSALVALGRIGGPGVISYLEDYLANPVTRADAALAIGLAAKGTSDLRLVARLAELASEVPKEDNWMVARAISLIDGTESRDVLKMLLAGLCSFRRVDIEWHLNGVTLQRALETAVEVGLLPEVPAAERIDAVRKCCGVYESDYIVFFHLLEVQDAIVDVWWLEEPRQMPTAHDELIETLSACSRGVFKPEAIQQTWRRVGEDGGDYTVQFVYDGRLYRFTARNFGPVPDSTAVFHAVHLALRDSGRTERFLPLYRNESGYMVIFADSAKLDRTSEALYLPVLNDFAIYEPTAKHGQ